MNNFFLHDLFLHQSPHLFIRHRPAGKANLPIPDFQDTKLSVEPETVLVVDDDPVVRKYMSVVLQKAGYEVVTAENGEEALDVLAEHAVDTVVSDVIMPKMNGMEMYRALKKGWPELNVIFVSGYSADILNSEDLEKGNLRFLQKPVMKETLLRMVRDVLDGPKN